MATSRQARAAFTLVELLVVIGIIALLISILLPSLNRARQSAQTVACLSNLRQQGTMLAMYTTSNRGFIPMADAQDGAGTYVPAGEPALYWRFLASTEYETFNADKQRSIFVCPEAVVRYPIVGQSVTPAAGEAWFWSSTYSANYWCGWAPNGVRPKKISQVRSSAETMFVGDGWYSDANRTWMVISPGGGPGASNWPEVVHGQTAPLVGKINFVFFDGHAETRPSGEIPFGDYFHVFWSGNGEL